MPSLPNADQLDAALGSDLDGNRLDSGSEAEASKSGGSRDKAKLAWHGDLDTSTSALNQSGSNGSPSCAAWGVNHPDATAVGYRHG